MFGSIGGPEFLLIAVLALLLFGPRKLPQIGRSIGRALSEFRGATQEFKTSLQREVDLEEIRKARNGLDEARREITETVKEAALPTTRPADPGEEAPSTQPAGSPDEENSTQS